MMEWRTERMEELRDAIAVVEPKDMMKVLLTLWTDETFYKFGLEEEEVNWTFNNTTATPEYVEKFMALDARFSEVSKI
jgi:hypothetical protein